MSTMIDSKLRRRLRSSAIKYGARPAVWVNGRTYSYSELFGRAELLAEKIDRQICRGGAIGIHCQRDISSIVGIIAAVLSGRSYLPLNPGFPEERLQAILRIATPVAMVCAPETMEIGVRLAKFSPNGPAVFDVDGKIHALNGSTPTFLEVADRPALYTLFTSGTTGEPKGVTVLDANVEAYVDGIELVVGLRETDRTSHFFDLSFDLSAHDIFVTFLAGAELSVLPHERNMAIVDFAEERQLTSWFSVPSLVAFCDRLHQLRPSRLSQLRNVLFCGEPLPVALARKMAQTAPQANIWNLYGPTEATIAFTAYELQRPDMLGDMAVVPLGKPIGDQHCVIDGERDAGELLLCGSQVTPGYINSPKLNKEKFGESAQGTRFYRTGDLVKYSERHGYIFDGRIDDQVKINGYRVELLEIDAVLREVAGTLEVAAIAWPPSSSGMAEYIVAFVTRPDASPAEIRKACRGRLPEYMVPRRVMMLDHMPTTASGKIDRKTLVRELSGKFKTEQ